MDRPETISGTKKKDVNSEASTIYILSHTHWDSEWYKLYEAFNIQLIPLIDNLFDALEKDPKFKFHFDGQVLPLIDYLEILKEEDDTDNKKRVKKAEEKIHKFIQKKQLSIGPCWNTPETSLISLESLIRNINTGIRFSKKFGDISQVFYNADAFQYHSQVPQIIKGTGLKTAFTWRAFKKGKLLEDISLWEGADKTTIPKFTPARSYAQVWSLPNDPKKALKIIEKEAKLLKNFAVTKHVLFTQGNDQFEAQTDINRIINKINKINGKYPVVQTSLEEFFEIIEREKPKLKTIKGELTGNEWACILSGQLSTRMYLKQKNKEAEIALEKWAEPFATFSWLLGNIYPLGFLERAWKYVMKQHFHLCNACGIDEVHQEGEIRYKNAIEIAEGITSQSLEEITLNIDTSKIIKKGEEALVIYNPSNTERTEVTKVELNFKDKSYNRRIDEILGEMEDKYRGNKNLNENPEIPNFILKNAKGEKIPYQIIKKQKDSCEIAFLAEKIPSFGYKTYGLEISDQKIPTTKNIANKKEKSLENDLVKVRIESNGSFTLINKLDGEVFKNQNIIEDETDHGDTYNYDPLKGYKPINTKKAKGKISLIENGPLLATYKIKTKLMIPEGLTPDRKARSKVLKKLPITIYITLKKDSPQVYISTKINNQINDHRLRALFPGVKNDFVYVQTQGDVVTRQVEEYKEYPQTRKRNITHKTHEGNLPKEKGPSQTQFQRSFIGTNDRKKGLVVINKGLPEYEAKTDGTIALTLLRSVGWLSQDDLSTREGSAGPELEVHEAQCTREHNFEYSVLPQAGSWDTTSAYHHANQHNVQMKSQQIPYQKGTLPPKMSFISINPKELIVSAVKKAYNRNDLIIRLFNPTEKKVKGSLKIYPEVKEAWLTDLNETLEEKLSIKNDGSVSLEADPKKIITVSYKLKQK
ncbi:MAG: hypothetical protein ISS23_02040 [Nanoarchaeota archaeon]|nr:hypothetical protein [Nanoarchaeota archaeon]